MEDPLNVESGPSSPKKRKLLFGKGKPLNAQCREFVCNVRNYFILESTKGGPLISHNKVIQRTAEALSISPRTVLRVYKEKFDQTDKGTELDTPGKHRPKARSKIRNLNPFEEDSIRSHIYDFYCRKERPTVIKLLASLKEACLYDFGRTTLWHVLKEQLGFQYRKINGQKLLLERTDIAAARCRFLRSIRQNDIKEVVWVDETIINIERGRKERMAEKILTNANPNALGNGGSFVLVHAGTSQGFVKNCSLLFETKKQTSEDDELITVQQWYKWFEWQLLPSLKKPSIIVLDSKDIHCAVLDQTPSFGNNKTEIVAWLERHNVHPSSDLNKYELLELADNTKTETPKYFIDVLAKQRGHTILRLPPYHRHFNAIERIWLQIKAYVASNIETYTMNEIESLIRDAINMPARNKNWEDIVNHTKEIIDAAWKRESLLEEAIEEVIKAARPGFFATKETKVSEIEIKEELEEEEEEDDEDMVGEDDFN